MSRVVVVCEGETEEEFVRDVLAPEFYGLGLYLEPQMVETSPGHRGGALNYDRVKLHLRNTLRKKSAPVVTTLLDFYKLDNDFRALSSPKRYLIWAKSWICFGVSCMRMSWLLRSVSRNNSSPTSNPMSSRPYCSVMWRH